MLERYDAYHGGNPYLDRVIWKIIPDTNAAVAQLRAGGLDFISNIPPQPRGHCSRIAISSDVRRRRSV